jgi:hypothetical protein
MELQPYPFFYAGHEVGMSKTKTKKPKPRKTRNWEAVKAHGRNSQGAHKDRKKQRNKERCRKHDQDD